MESDDLKEQLKDILTKTEEIVCHAHALLRQNEISQIKYVELRALATKTQEICNRFDNENC